jgi:hypothetical protein
MPLAGSESVPFFLQLLFCVPLWIVVALFVSIRKARRAEDVKQRTLWRRWAIVIGFTLCTSLLWANPIQMLFRSGPFRGRVVDAQTGKPVPVALLSFTWGGSLGVLSAHHAWTMTDAEGNYRVGWQGIGNWRIGAFPGPDSMTVIAPGYVGGQFWLDGEARDPYSDHDRTALGASMADGEIRLQRLRTNVRLDLEAARHFGFGVPAAEQQQRIARRFHDVLYAGLCPGAGTVAKWEPTDAAFQQLVEYSGFFGISPSDLLDGIKEVVVGYQYSSSSRNTPLRLDAADAERLCNQLELTDREM